MKNTSQITSQIRHAFHGMKDKDDLVKVLNLAKLHIFGSKAQEIPLKAVTYYADPRLAKNRYTIFHIPKKSGGKRTIHAPVHGLKAILRSLNFVLQSIFEEHFDSAATGFTPGKSVVDNARVHSHKAYVLNLDLKDFFPSIELHRIKAVLRLPPFNLKGEREPLAFLIANLCCYEMEVERPNQSGEMVTKRLPVLPQGAPTSPTLTNIICRRLDFYLKAVGKRFGATYSRYADDISFSGNKHIYQKEGAFITEIRRIIQTQGFVVNENKVRLLRPWHRQEVTGLTVNLKPNVERAYVKEIRKWIYLWETYGLTKAELLFKRDYSAAASGTSKIIPPLDRVLDGKLRYMYMVVGEGHPTYTKLKERLDLLINGGAVVTLPKTNDLNRQLELLLDEIGKELELDELFKTFNKE